MAMVAMSIQRRYNSYQDYLRQRFGCRVHKVSLDMGFSCPNRDGTIAIGGCIYCNNDSFVPPYARSRYSMDAQLRYGIEYLRNRFKAQKFIVYFQAYTNTYGDVKELERMYKEALKYKEVVGLAIGTRSDCIDDKKIDMLEKIARSYYVTVEYGIESVYDKTLKFVNRGHDYASVIKAVELSRDRGIHIGGHVILGMPTETKEEMVAMADEISRLKLDSFKIHNLHVVKNTPLARMYKKNPFPLFSYEEYLDVVIRFIERLAPNIMLERLFTDTPRDLLIAPVWNLRHNEILYGIKKELERRNTFQGRLYQKATFT